MNVASRTPEGEPYACPICGAVTPLETSDAGDSLCPACGELLWKFRDSLEAVTLSPITSIALSDSITEHLTDSLEIVELVMRFEDRYGASIPDDAGERFRTVADVLRWLRERRSDD